MPPLWLSIAVGLVGLGWPLNWVLQRLALGFLWARMLSAVGLTLLIVVAQEAVEYPMAPRQLRQWQREAISLNIPTAPPILGRITFYVCTAESALESQDYSRKLMHVFEARKLSAAYGCDAAPNHIVVNQGKVIVPPENDVFLRARGVELWVLDPEHPPLAAKQMARALTAAGIPLAWKPDIRLAGVEAYDRYRIPINGPQCIIVVGSKPPFSWRSFLYTERQFLRFRSQHPPEPGSVMYWAAIVYAFLIFVGPLALSILWLGSYSASRRMPSS